MGWRAASPFERLASRLLFRHPRVWWVAVSEVVREQLLEKGVPPGRITVAPAYIPPSGSDDLSGLPGYLRDFLGSHAPVLSTYGSWLTLDEHGVDMYGFDHCIEAIKALKAEHPGIGLVISLPAVTNVEYFRELNERVAASGIQGNVLFVTDPLDDTSPLWQASDVFLRATNTDGDAVSVREALHLHVPVVASDASARPDGVVLFETRNLEALVRAVREVLADREAHVRALRSVSIDDNFPPVLKLYRAIA